jgi:phosphodiesterase/alkaline phosphatase D-like protein
VVSAHNAIRRIGRVGVAVLATLGGYLALAAGPAGAFIGHTLTPTAVFGSAGSGNGQFSRPAGVAVDDSSGDVYVVDQGNNRVEKFDAEGNYLAQFTGAETPAGSFSEPYSVAVDNTSGPAKGDVYVTDVGHNVIDVFGSTGKYLSQIVGAPSSFAGKLSGVAVDASGNVWAYENTGNVDEFSDTGSFTSQFNTGRGTTPGFAVDASSNVYLLFGCGCVGKYSKGAQLAEWGEGGVALAVNETTNNVFVDKSSSIEEFGAFGEPYGTPAQTFGSGGISSSKGVAVNGANGAVYASESEANAVAIFKGVLLPDVTTGAASNVTRTSAKLEGIVNPDGQEVTSCRFEYGTSTAYGQTAACVPAPGSGSSPVAVSAELSGLTPNKIYHYRLVAGNSNGPNPGFDHTFTTLAAVPRLQTESANVEEHVAGTIVATLSGSLEPAGADTHYYFEYGETEAYGSVSPALPGTDAGEAFRLEHAHTELAGLKPEATYHFRLVASNSFGTERGADLTLTTPGVVPNLQTEAATNVELSGRAIVATLNGSFAPNGADTHYYFEYGETEAYGSVSPALPGTDAGQAFRLEHAHTQLTGLKPYVLYHFRLVATNSFGTTRGADVTFNTTGLVLPPVVGAVPASNVSQFAATLNGTLETGQALVNYHFEYGTSVAYGQVAPIPDSYTPTTGETVAVSQSVGGLLAGTTYHYRLVASSPGATDVAGPDETFTTPPIPAPSVATGGASGIGVGAATLSGAVDPHGWDTTYYFQYGTSAAYGSSWPTVPVDLGALEGAQGVQVSVQNLLPGTTYHYRLVAASGGGTSYGPDVTFTTGEYQALMIQEPAALRTLVVPGGKAAEPSAKKSRKAKRGRKGRKRRRGGRARR